MGRQLANVNFGGPIYRLAAVKGFNKELQFDLFLINEVINYMFMTITWIDVIKMLVLFLRA